MKRVLSLLLAAGMACSLAACGGNTTAGDTAENTDQSSASGSDKVWVIATDTVFKPLSTPTRTVTLSASTSILSRRSPRIRASSIR